MRQYLLLTHQRLLPKSEMRNPSNLLPAVRRFLQGMVYLAMMILFLPMYSETYLKSKEFKVGADVHLKFVYAQQG